MAYRLQFREQLVDHDEYGIHGNVPRGVPSRYHGCQTCRQTEIRYRSRQGSLRDNVEPVEQWVEQLKLPSNDRNKHVGGLLRVPINPLYPSARRKSEQHYCSMDQQGAMGPFLGSHPENEQRGSP